MIQSTSDEAPGLLASVEHHLGAHHSPDVFHVQPALSKAMAVPMAAKQRAAAQTAAKAAETLKRVQAPLDHTNGERAKRGPGRPPTATPCLEQVTQDVEAARQAHQRRVGQRAQGTQSIRAIGHAYHFVAVERGVRRNSKLSAGDIQKQIDTMRTLAQQEGLSQACLDRIEKAERVVPNMQATIEFVSGYGRQQVQQLDLAPPASYAMHAHLIPSCYLERVASTRTVTEGEPLRALAGRMRALLFASGGVLGEFSLRQHDQRKAEAAKLAEVFQRSSAKVEGRHGSLSLRNHPAARTRPPQKARMSHSDAPLLPHAA